MNDLEEQDTPPQDLTRRRLLIATVVSIVAMAVGGYLYAQRTEEHRPAGTDNTSSAGFSPRLGGGRAARQ